MQLNVLQDLTIDVASRIDVSGQGNAPDAGFGAGAAGVFPYGSGGGAGYGGQGGSGSFPGGGSYGSAEHPVDLGSGGGSSRVAAGAGGGAMRVVVLGRLQLDGNVLANGGAGGFIDGGQGAGGGSSCGKRNHPSISERSNKSAV